MNVRLGERCIEFSLYALAAVMFFAGRAPFGGIRGFNPDVRTAGSLRIVSWNVGAGTVGGGDALRDELLPAVAERLARLEPDLCVIQELAGRRQFRALLRELGPDWSGELSPAGEDRRVAILSSGPRLSRLKGLDLPRRALAVVVDSPRAEPWICAGLHADAYSADLRNEQIGGMVELLEAFAGARPRLLAGDLNLDLDLDKKRDLFSDDEHRDVETYNYVAQRMLDVGLGSGATAEPDRRLDYVFVDPSAWRPLSAGPWLGQRLDGMDHHPLVCDLELVR